MPGSHFRMIVGRFPRLACLVGFLPLAPLVGSISPRRSTAIDAALIPYRPLRPVAGVIAVAGADNLDGILQRWAGEFERVQPGAKVRVDGTTRLSSEGVEALLDGRAQVAPMARELFPSEAARLTAKFGRAPLMVCIALGSFDTPHNTDAIAIFVNAANPLRRLTLAQLDAIFSQTRRRGQPADITSWGQLGLGAPWSDRPIHLYGMMLRRPTGNPPGIVNFLEQKLLDGGTFKASLRQERDHDGVTALNGVIAAVAADPDGIGYGVFGGARPGAKALALAADPAGPYLDGTPASVASGGYPLTRQVYLCLGRTPAQPLSPLLVEFLRFALSRNGQEVVAEDSSGYLPLSAVRVATEGARLSAASEPAPGSGLPDCRSDRILNLAAPPAANPAAAQRLPRYVPRPVRVPPHAPYRTSTGAIAIVGYRDMQGMLRRFDALFERTHPGVTFTLILTGTRSAPPALASGRSLLAPMGAELLPGELAAYVRVAGAPPVDFRIAHDSLSPQAKSGPIGIFVARDNPLQRLTTQQVARIFAGGANAITTWGELGLTGAWAGRPIHPCGLAARTALGTYMERHHFGGGAFVSDCVALPESADVVRQVGRDPLAIGFAALNRGTPEVRLLAIGTSRTGPYSRASVADLQAGRYPYDRYLHLCVRREPDGTVDPVAREYLRLVLSREGQEIVATDPLGYVPLGAAEAARERARIH